MKKNISISNLLIGHREFRKKFAVEQAAFSKLATEGQKPQALWIGCSDSRVIPEHITNAKAGELFVVRNIANVVPPAGLVPSVGTAIEYAVLHLHVPHIIICGHTECGGIKALEQPVDVIREPHLARWVELIRPALIKVKTARVSEEERDLETIKANVLIQMDNLQTYKCVREAISAGKLMTHGWLYDLHKGQLFAYNNHSKTWRVL